MNKELRDTIKIYKIIIPIIVIILLTGIIISIFAVKKTVPVEKPPVQAPPAQIPEQSIPTAEINQTTQVDQVNQTTLSNQTIIQANQTTDQTIAQPANQTINASAKYAWEGITIQFPDSMKTVTKQYATSHYLNITEADNTPLSNEEQFKLDFYVIGMKKSQIIPTYQNKQWLVTLMLTNKGKYTLEVQITCADKRGHCQRLYPQGSITKTYDFQVV